MTIRRVLGALAVFLAVEWAVTLALWPEALIWGALDYAAVVPLPGWLGG